MARPIATRLALPLAATVAVALGGCTQATNEPKTDARFKGEDKKVADAVTALSKAVRRPDYGRVCDRSLSRELVAQIERTAGKRCRDALARSISPADALRLDVEKVTVKGRRATVVVSSEISRDGKEKRRATLGMTKPTSGDWQVSDLGS